MKVVTTGIAELARQRRHPVLEIVAADLHVDEDAPGRWPAPALR